MYYVYVLKSAKTNQNYGGITNDIERRLKGHHNSLSRYKKSRGPWRLIHLEEKKTLGEAEKRERFLKSGDGRNVFKQLFKSKIHNSHWGMVSRLKISGTRCNRPQAIFRFSSE